MRAMVSQIANLTIIYSTVYSGANQRKHQSSASLAFVRGIHRWPVNSPHKGPVTRKVFPFDDVIMNKAQSVWIFLFLGFFIFQIIAKTICYSKIITIWDNTDMRQFRYVMNLESSRWRHETVKTSQINSCSGWHAKRILKPGITCLLRGESTSDLWIPHTCGFPTQKNSNVEMLPWHDVIK